MKSLLLIAALCTFLDVGVCSAVAAEQEVTLKGTATCAKCDLGKTKSCQAALKVTEEGKEVVYYVTMDAEGKKMHREVCKEPKKDVSVTGVVSEKEGQKWITASRIAD